MIPKQLAAVFLVLAIVGIAPLSALDSTPEPEPSASTIKISNSWARLQPPSSRMSAAYMEVQNAGESADALIGASCSCAKSVELHVMTEKDGMMNMRQVERFEVAPGATIKLEPGGAHLMIMGLKEPLSVEKALDIELVFERAGKLAVTVPVKDPR